MKVLIVDDQPDERNMVAALVVEMGFGVLATETGEQAHQIALREHTYMAIIKTELPDMRGMQLFYSIRMNPDLREMVVMLASPNPSEEEVIEGFSLYSDFHWTYPLDADQLTHVLRMLALPNTRPGFRFEHWDFSKVRQPHA